MCKLIAGTGDKGTKEISNVVKDGGVGGGHGLWGLHLLHLF